METMWLKEALFAGMTSNAFKLGTVLSLGWFWMRTYGCSVLYRGPSMERVDFANILVVDKQYAGTISPPNYIQHENSSTYFYVVRRVNDYGQQEHTLAAAVRISIDDNGDLVQLGPNSIFTLKAEQVAGGKVQLVWFYCPIGQKQKPVCFKVYCDEGVGQISYGNPIATISYEGVKYCTYQTGTLEANTYLFAIKVQDANGTEDTSLLQLRIQINTDSPQEVDILNIGTF